MNPKHLPLLLALATNLPAAATSTEPFPPSAGEGRGGVSLQTTETNSEPAAPPQTILNPNRKYNLGIIIPQDEIQPDTLEAPDAQSARLPETLLDAAQAAENPIDYTPPDKPLPDIHANASGRATEKPAPGGYSRKILGLTADGRPVVQDYWQDSGAPKTAPFTLKEGASLRDFTTAAVDGKIIWYQPDGSIRAIQQYRDGAPASRLNYYHNGRLAIQGDLPPDVAEPDDPYRSAGEADKGIRYYYENGQLLALDYGHRVLNCYNGCKSWNILYDENGQPLAAGHGTRNGCLIGSDHWSSLNHTPADQQAARRQTFDAALARKAMLEQLLRDSSDINPAIKPPFAADAGNKPAPATPASQPPAPAGAERGGNNPQTAEANSEPAPATTTNQPPPPWGRDGVGAANNPRSDSQQNKAQPEPASHPDSRYNLRTWSSAGIEPDTMSAPPALPPQPASTYDAATAAKTDIAYTPYDSAIGTFPGNNDYSYRTILGETADGRLVIQDYYRNSDRPRTAPYILNRYGDPQDPTAINADSKLVWYRQDGSVYAIQHYHDGQPAGYLSFYRNGRLVAQKARPGNDNDFYAAIGAIASAGTRYYYDDGHILALEYHHGRVGSCNMGAYCKEDETLYAPDGTPLIAWQSIQIGNNITHQSWNTLNTTPADQQAARRQSIDAALTRWDDIKQRLSDNDLNQPYHHDETANQPPPPAGAEQGGVSPHTDESNREPAPAITTELPPPPWGRDGVGAANNPRSDNRQTEPDDLAAPADLPAPLLPETILDAAQAAANPIDYTPLSYPDYYADRYGLPTRRAVSGGYIRKILGKTADGRLVVQDYYQDSGTPQTAPLTLKKDADPADFSPTAVDGKIVWYRPDGSIRAIQQYRDGAAVSPLNYYHEGRLAIQKPLPGQPDDPYRQLSELADGIRYYHKNGQILAFDRNPFTYALYNDQGKPLYIQITHLGHSPDSYHWNTLNSTPAEQQAARRKTLDAAWARKTMLEQLLRNNGDPNPEPPSPPAGAERGEDSPQPTEPNREPAPATTTVQPPPPVGEERGGVSLHTAESNSEPAAATPANQPPPPVGEGRGGVSLHTSESNSEPVPTTTTELPPPPWAGTHKKCERIFCGNRRRVGVGAANNPRSDSLQNKSQKEPAAGNADAPPISMESLPAPPALPVQPLPEDILDAKQAAHNPIDYTPLLPPATTAPLYADHDGKPATKPVSGGYYRKTLGNTADGCRVVQDYYQDSDTPQTAPFTLKKDANPADFSPAAVDGKIVWYRKDGSIRAIQQYKNGEAVSPLYTYHEGRLAVATPQPGLPFDDLYNSAGEISRGLRYYHENGQILALERHILPCNGYCERWLNLYDEQGQPLYAEHFRKDGDLGSFRRWRAPEYRPAAGQEKTFLASQSATHREDRSLVYLAASIRYNTLRKMLQYEGL